ncbi:MAG: hypothetical protein KBS81_07240, partial [Spirochaetales bacterium]|nr:hypothetical protein [Candidatus Physcosoma equi]
MDARTVKDTEFGKVLEDIRRYALSPEGKEAITPECVTSDKETLEERYVRIDSYMNKLEGAEPLDTFPSISHIFDFVEKTHGDIPGSDIYKAGEFLSSYFKLMAFLEKNEEIHAEDILLKDDILSSIDMEGEVNEDHPRLRPLIKKREEMKNERYRFSSQYIQENRAIIQNENPLYRNERVVIPIRSSEKRSDDYYIAGQ